jgi:tetratricopeptide (TPR) repeat protein
MQGDYDRAIADCTEAIRLDPKYAWAYSSRGHAFAAKGDFRSALADLMAYLRLDPTDELVKQTLEEVKQEQARAQSRNPSGLSAEQTEVPPGELGRA